MSHPPLSALYGLSGAFLGAVGGALRWALGGPGMLRWKMTINQYDGIDRTFRRKGGGQSLFKSTYRLTFSYLQVPFWWTCWQALGASSSIDIP